MKVKLFKQNTFLSLEKEINSFFETNPAIKVTHTTMVPQGDSITMAVFYE